MITIYCIMHIISTIASSLHEHFLQYETFVGVISLLPLDFYTKGPAITSFYVLLLLKLNTTLKNVGLSVIWGSMTLMWCHRNTISGGQPLCLVSCWCYVPIWGSDRQGGSFLCLSSRTRHRRCINCRFGYDLLKCHHLAASCGYDFIQKPNRTWSCLLFGNSAANIHEKLWRWCQYGLVCSMRLDYDNTQVRLEETDVDKRYLLSCHIVDTGVTYGCRHDNLHCHEKQQN